MKAERILALLLALLLILPGCGKTKAEAVMFYYRSETLTPESDVVVSETSGFRTDGFSSDVLDAYLSGPEGKDAVMFLPEGTKLNGYLMKGNTLTLYFTDEISRLSGVDLAIASACLSRTFTQFDNISEVIFSADHEKIDGQSAICIGQETQYQFTDNTAELISQTVQLCYPNADSRFLATEEEKVTGNDTAEKALNALERIRYRAMNSGCAAQILKSSLVESVTITDGVCTVNLSESFYSLQEEEESMQRLLVLAMVNTLTGMENVSSVRFRIHDQSADSGFYTDLNISFVEEPDAVGSARASVSETEGSLYLVNIKDGALFAIPCRVKAGENQSPLQALLEALYAYGSINGFSSPNVNGTAAPAISESEAAVTVELTSDQASAAGCDPDLLCMSVKNTLSSATEKQVLVLLDGVPVTDTQQEE